MDVKYLIGLGLLVTFKIVNEQASERASAEERRLPRRFFFDVEKNRSSILSFNDSLYELRQTAA